MQTRSRSRAVATPRPQQSIAALLPEEIIESIIENCEFDYSLGAEEGERKTRDIILGQLSLVAEGWTTPARRMLFRNLRIRDGNHMKQVITAWMGKAVHSLSLTNSSWSRLASREMGGALFDLLKKLPNLRIFRTHFLPFMQFPTVAFLQMRHSAMLPHLTEITIFGDPFAPAVVLDLLATSNHRISRLKMWTTTPRHKAPLLLEQFDFRGNLRILAVGSQVYDALLHPTEISLSHLEGLRELELWYLRSKWSQQADKFFGIIAPSLEKLTVKGLVAPMSPAFHLLANLSHLRLQETFDDISLLLLHLPPSLRYLRIDDDRKIQPVLSRWMAVPSLVPSKLKEIRIDSISDINTLKNLPQVERFSTSEYWLLSLLRRLDLGTLRCKTVDMIFCYENWFGEEEEYEEERRRLNIVFEWHEEEEE